MSTTPEKPAETQTPTPTPTQPTATTSTSTSGMAIAGLICAFLFPLLGLIFSIIGLNQTKDGKQGGRGLAIAGLIISILGMLAGLFWFIIFIIAAASTPTTTTSTSFSDSFNSTPETSVVSAGVGEEVTVEGIDLTVTSVERGFTPESEFFTPESGKEYVAVNVSLVNNGDNSQSFGTYSFKLRDSSGLELNSTYVGTVAGELETGSLAAGGGNTKGLVIFEAPAGDQNLVLIFEPSFYGEVAEVKL